MDYNMRVSCPNCGNHVTFDKQLEIPMSESRIVQACMNCQADVFLVAKYGIQPPENLYQDPQWLFDSYVVQQRTLADIAKQFGVSSMTIQYWLRAHTIPARSRGRKQG
tara:strand:+ start:526 stop:849 length:324 start_codon:yes stop_codon:yes gene_type:complete